MPSPERRSKMVQRLVLLLARGSDAREVNQAHLSKPGTHHASKPHSAPRRRFSSAPLACPLAGSCPLSRRFDRFGRVARKGA
jgi:hypothetical protein